MCSVSCCKFSCARDLVPPPALHWGRCSHTCGKCIAPTNLEQLQDLVLADVGIGSENEIGATLGKWFRHFLQNSARTDANSVSELYEALEKPSWPVRCWKCGPCLHCSSTKCCRAGERVLFWDLCWINFVSLCICLCVGRLYHMAVVRWALLRVFLYTVWFTMYIPSIACRAPFDLFSWCSIRASCFCFQLFQDEHLFLDWIRNPRGSKGSSLVQPGSAWFSLVQWVHFRNMFAARCRLLQAWLPGERCGPRSNFWPHSVLRCALFTGETNFSALPVL